MPFEILKKAGDKTDLIPGCVAAATGYTDGSLVLHKDAQVLTQPEYFSNFYISPDYYTFQLFRHRDRPQPDFEVPQTSIRGDFIDRMLKFSVTSTLVDWTVPDTRKPRIELQSEETYWRPRTIRPFEIVPTGRKFYKWVHKSNQLYFLLETENGKLFVTKYESEEDLNWYVMSQSVDLFMKHENDLIRDLAIGVIHAKRSFKKMVDLLKKERRAREVRSRVK